MSHAKVRLQIRVCVRLLSCRRHQTCLEPRLLLLEAFDSYSIPAEETKRPKQNTRSAQQGGMLLTHKTSGRDASKPNILKLAIHALCRVSKRPYVLHALEL